MPKAVRQPSNYTNYLGLINECLLVCADTLAEHVVRPALIGKHNRDKDQRDNGHDSQSVLRRGCIVDGQ